MTMTDLSPGQDLAQQGNISPGPPLELMEMEPALVKVFPTSLMAFPTPLMVSGML